MPLDSPIWNQSEVEQIVSNGLTRLAKRFKQKTVDNMIMSTPSGVLYAPGFSGQGAGFRRYHQASARGERPAPDTMNLVLSVSDEKVSSFEHDVFVDDNRAPYGRWLQNPAGLNRPIATLVDAEMFMSTEGMEEVEKTKAELIR